MATLRYVNCITIIDKRDDCIIIWSHYRLNWVDVNTIVYKKKTHSSVIAFQTIVGQVDEFQAVLCLHASVDTGHELVDSFGSQTVAR